MTEPNPLQSRGRNVQAAPAAHATDGRRCATTGTESANLVPATSPTALECPILVSMASSRPRRRRQRLQRSLRRRVERWPPYWRLGIAIPACRPSACMSTSCSSSCSIRRWSAETPLLWAGGRGRLGLRGGRLLCVGERGQENGCDRHGARPYPAVADQMHGVAFSGLGPLRARAIYPLLPTTSRREQGRLASCDQKREEVYDRAS